MSFRYIGIIIVCAFCIILSSCGVNNTNNGFVNTRKDGFLSIFSSNSHNKSASNNSSTKDTFFSSIGSIFNRKNIFYQTDVVQSLDGLFFATLSVPIPVLEKNDQPDDIKKHAIKSESDLYSNINISDKKIKNQTEKLYQLYVRDLRYRNDEDNSLMYANNKLLPSTANVLDVLVNQNTNQPRILYVVYSNLRGLKKNDVKEQLYLTSYLNLIKSYSYSKKISNIFIQEVQFDDLPLNTVLVVLKSITAEQFKILPKQINVYNATKMTYKNWLAAHKTNLTK